MIHPNLLALACEIDDMRNRNARTICEFHELEHDIKELTGFSLEQLKALFAKGYTLQPPDWISQHG